MSLEIPFAWHRKAMPSATILHGIAGTYDVTGPFSKLRVVISTGFDWEHASVSKPGARHCPSWEAMCWVKDQLWQPEDVVMQLHPRRSQYVNDQPYTLHLWRPLERAIPEPHRFFVGRYDGWLDDQDKLAAFMRANPDAWQHELPEGLL